MSLSKLCCNLYGIVIVTHPPLNWRSVCGRFIFTEYWTDFNELWRMNKWTHRRSLSGARPQMFAHPCGISPFDRLFCSLDVWFRPAWILQAEAWWLIMSGHVSGVQQRIRVDHPCAMYIHCLSHKLNLVLVNSCNVNRTAVGFFNTIDELFKYFSKPRAHNVF